VINSSTNTRVREEGGRRGGAPWKSSYSLQPARADRCFLKELQPTETTLQSRGIM